MTAAELWEKMVVAAQRRVCCPSGRCYRELNLSGACISDNYDREARAAIRAAIKVMREECHPISSARRACDTLIRVADPASRDALRRAEENEKSPASD